MYFIGIKIILARPMGQKISGCKMTGSDTVGVAIVNATWNLMGESFLYPEYHYTADVGCKLFREGTVLEK